MADVLLTLVSGTYSAVKRPLYSTEVVKTDGGATHRNARWSQPLPTWDVTTKWMKRTSPEFLALLALFEATKGSHLSFSFHDTVECEDVDVFFVDDVLDITPNGNLVQASFTLEAER
jgi:uncharacterized protein (TIGR02217 family)